MRDLGSTIESAPSTRQVLSWIDGFSDYTRDLFSPLAFRRWAAISAVAGALERRVWLHSMGQKLFPNLFVVLVGPPGIGKTNAISEVDGFWRSIPDLKVAPTSVTTAALISSLARSTRTLPQTINHHLDVFNSLLIPAREFSVLIPVYDSEFLSVLGDLYDGGLYEESRRGRETRESSGNIRLEQPHIHLLGGTTPSYLGSFMPEGAWAQGFISRTILIHSDELVYVPLFRGRTDQSDLRKKLLSDLRQISQLRGAFFLEPDAETAIETWNRSGRLPVPTHPRLEHYASRRMIHVLKLCEVASAARSNSMCISLADFLLARQWLLEAEKEIPAIFQNLSSSIDGAVLDDLIHHVEALEKETGRPVFERQIISFIRKRTRAQNVLPILEMAVKEGILYVISVAERGQSQYRTKKEPPPPPSTPPSDPKVSA